MSMDLTAILDDCLERLARGESRAEVLARYGDDAHALAPALDAAAQLAALAAPRLTHGQRLRAKMALRETLAAAHEPRPVPLFGRLRLLPAALVLAIILIGALSVSAVASSQPGDATYAVRVLAERVPALVKFTPASRAAAELDAADRRLADLGRDLATSGNAHPAALDALLEGEAAAVRRALRSEPADRARLVQRMSGQADGLAALAADALNPQAAARLRAAATQARALARALETGSAPPTPPPAPSAPDPAADETPADRLPLPAPTATPSPQATALASATATATATSGRTPRPTRTSSPAPTSSAPTATPAWTPRPTHTPWSTRTRPPEWTPPPMRTPPLTHTPPPTRIRPPEWTPQPSHTPLPTRTRPPEWTPRPTRTRPAEWTPRPMRTPTAPGLSATPTPPDTPAPGDTAAPTAAIPEATASPAETPATSAPPAPTGPPAEPSPGPGGPGPRRP